MTTRHGLGLLVATAIWAGGASAAPQRIASLNLCADQLVLELVDPSRITSVTWLARDATQSAMADAAMRVPINHGKAEEIIPQNPDLVLVGQFTVRAATALLRRLGARVETVGQPRDLAGVRAEILRAGALLGEEARAAEVVTRLDRRLAALPPATLPRPVAALLRPNGVTAGPGSLVDSLLAAAGYENFSARLGLDRNDRLPLEALIVGRPDILVIDRRDFALPSLAQTYQNLPMVGRAVPRRVVIPNWAWVCAGSAIAEAAERLAAGRLDS